MPLGNKFSQRHCYWCDLYSRKLLSIRATIVLTINTVQLLSVQEHGMFIVAAIHRHSLTMLGWRSVG